MINDLRKKFVIVTMLLMITVLGILAVSISLYNSYWSDLEMLQLVEWVSDSGIFTEGVRPDSEFPPEDEDSIVLGIIADKEGSILVTRSVGEGTPETVSDTLVKKILAADSRNWKLGTYIYSTRSLEEGKTLIVLVNMENNGTEIWRIIGYGVLAAAALLALGGMTFLLSGFVTGPAKKALEREKQFIADASHELKTPLGAISINAQALEMDDAENIHIRNILSETGRMNRLLERLLTLSRLEEDAPFKKTEFSLSEAAEEILLTYESLAYEKKIDYQYDLMEGLTHIGDPEEFRQLVAILLDNAIKHTPDKGNVSASLAKTEDKLLFTVKNTGHIPEEDLPHVFERFYSTDRSRTGGSFGLGLSIARAITHRLGGRILAENQGDQVVFSVSL